MSRKGGLGQEHFLSFVIVGSLILVWVNKSQRAFSFLLMKRHIIHVNSDVKKPRLSWGVCQVMEVIKQ